MNIIISKLNELAMPDPHYFPDKFARHHQFERNKTFLAMLLTIVVALAFNLLLIDKPASFGYFYYMGHFFMITIVFCCTKHLHPTVFKLFYTFAVSIVGPIVVYFDKDGVFGGWVTVHLSPLFLLLVFDSYFLYFLQVGTQIIFLKALYKNEMLKNIDSRMTDEYVIDLADVTAFIVVAKSVMMYKLNTLLENNFKHELASEEQKIKDLQVQKTFILSFSHEIRNLINTLIGNIQLSLLEKVTPKVKTCLEEAEVGASLLIQLINNILDSGNLDVGDLEMNPTTKVIHSTLEKMWTMCAHVLKSKNLKGQLRISKDLPKCLRIDHERLIQILINLITNAVKFTEQGSVDIKIEWIKDSTEVTDESFLPAPFDDENEGLFEKNLALSVLRNEFTILGIEKKRWSSDRYNTVHEPGPGILKVTVTDTGSGVLSENLPRVFDRFSHHIFGDSSSKRLGTTVGLYVTKELCNRMKGDIRVFSKVNRGTTFIVCLPAQQIINEPSSAPKALTHRRKLRAMIVDDLSFNIVVLTNYLQRMQIDIVETALNGKEAYNKYIQSVISGNPFDIVTMDVEMPVMDGKQAAQKIREFERDNNMKPCVMIMISGNVCESEISQCLRNEGKELANHFLKKPATFEDLNRVLSQEFSFSNLSHLSLELI